MRVLFSRGVSLKKYDGHFPLTHPLPLRIQPVLKGALTRPAADLSQRERFKSPQKPAAVDVDDGTVHESAGIAREKQHGVGDFVGLAVASERSFVAVLLHSLW